MELCHSTKRNYKYFSCASAISTYLWPISWAEDRHVVWPTSSMIDAPQYFFPAWSIQHTWPTYARPAGYTCTIWIMCEGKQRFIISIAHIMSNGSYVSNCILDDNTPLRNIWNVINHPCLSLRSCMLITQAHCDALVHDMITISMPGTITRVLSNSQLYYKSAVLGMHFTRQLHILPPKSRDIPRPWVMRLELHDHSEVWQTLPEQVLAFNQLDHRTLDQDMEIFIAENGFRNVICKMLAILPKW